VLVSLGFSVLKKVIFVTYQIDWQSADFLLLLGFAKVCGHTLILILSCQGSERPQLAIFHPAFSHAVTVSEIRIRGIHSIATRFPSYAGIIITSRYPDIAYGDIA
jgi:hypothetical protein